MYKSMLNLKDVQVRTITETSDGMGGLSTATTITTLSRAGIWQAGSRDSYLSDKVYKASSHVLAILPDEYSFTDNDAEILWDSKTFKLVGHEDNVSQIGKVKVIGMERLS